MPDESKDILIIKWPVRDGEGYEFLITSDYNLTTRKEIWYTTIDILITASQWDFDQ